MNELHQRIRLIRGEGGVITVEADDDVSVDEMIAFLEDEEPRLAERLLAIAATVRETHAPGISNQFFWQEGNP